jgi:hypothetical protein
MKRELNLLVNYKVIKKGFWICTEIGWQLHRISLNISSS